MIPPQISKLLETLQASGFRDVAGARAAATIPIGERLLNQIVAAALPPSAPVRDVVIQPQAGNRLSVRAKLTRLEFLPPITLTLAIERQPELPASPALVLRIAGLPGLLGFAGPLLVNPKLPPGVRLDGDRLTLDLAVALAHYGQRELLSYLERVHVTSEAGQLLIDIAARVP